MVGQDKLSKSGLIVGAGTSQIRQSGCGARADCREEGRQRGWGLKVIRPLCRLFAARASPVLGARVAGYTQVHQVRAAVRKSGG